MRHFRFAIDRGGTFTDVYAEYEGGSQVLKLLSEDPANYDNAPREGIRRIIASVTAKSIPKNCVPTEEIEFIRMGTTVATNALLERKGEPLVFVVTKGFRDVLHIGNQSRPKIFDLSVKMPGVLYEAVCEVDERVRVVHKSEDPSPEKLRRVIGITGEEVEIEKALDVKQVKKQLEELYKKGFRSVAVALMHSYTFLDHEKQVGEIAKSIGFTQVSLSSELMPMTRLVPRGLTACVDAYLTPKIKAYVEGFRSGFGPGLADVPLSFMQSDGGLAPVDQFCGFRAVLSGPAGGVVGYALTTYNARTGQSVIGFDMGGTSSDVSRFSGTYDHVYDTEIAGVMIQAPQLDINTVAAGGGSRLFWRSGLFVVGPESAGSHPGPVCYRKGGHLAVTDANLLLGRVLPQHFPNIFGPNEDQPLDVEATRRAFEELTAEVNRDMGTTMTPEEVALGFLTVANEAMCRPIRNLTEARGHDAAGHVLACFGGAGPQHACAMAQSLGMSKVFVHRYSSILSAYGIMLADVVQEVQAPCTLPYNNENMPVIMAHLMDLSEKAKSKLLALKYPEERIKLEPFLNLRYEGTDTALMIQRPNNDDFVTVFCEQYKQQYGFLLPDRTLIVDDLRVRGIGVSETATRHKRKLEETASGPATPSESVRVYYESGWQDTPVYRLGSLVPGQSVNGPALLMDANSTISILPACVATVTDEGDVSIDVLSVAARNAGTELDNVLLSIFSHRFMGIAEQMGRTLQRTSISTNIKERLDFSCAIFGPDGGLVANAPHLPVHLGSMQEAVKWQINHLGSTWKEGEVVLTNHPCAGGSHLPDFTVITPVFENGVPVFYVASRGHHADIGGISPGSMPPFSRTLDEEGAAIKSFKLVERGVFQEQAVTDLLNAPALIPRGPHDPPSSGTRNLRDNLSDLKAQVAANQKGILLTNELIRSYTLEVVQAYMGYIQANAEVAVRAMLKSIYAKFCSKGEKLNATDFMDDGTPISLTISIDPSKGSAVFDFKGTGPEVLGNCNSPRAVTYSAVIYVLRCLVDQDIPLNQGCLRPIDILLEDATILSPTEGAAVVGGNVLTSQRITDVILQAFRACASSQGCMNNLTFGDETVGYYETIAGGAGAGPTWAGRSGVHTHMTNTRITDAEIVERRYPVLVRQFGLRPGSGGAGVFRGGDGVIRELEALKRLNVGILSERRAICPPGMNGGAAGQKGLNLLIKANGHIVSIGGKNSVDVQRGDRIRILAPGGGGYGASA